MMNRHVNLGRTLIIANPCAQSGAAGVVAERLQRFLGLYLHDVASFDLVRTERPGHAAQLARAARGYDTVLALGGDGVVHEVANGLLAQPGQTRPALGLVPVGSGNDYARTLGIPESSGRDFAKLLTCERVSMDVGRILFWRGDGMGDRLTENRGRPADPTLAARRSAEQPREEYFVETFSVGLDAAIALGTEGLHAKTGLRGHALYTATGLNVFGLRYRRYPLTVSFDGEDPLELSALMMAVQIGPTYGSGFYACPAADPADGLFDICCATGPMSRARAISLFLRSRNGGHAGSRRVRIRRARRVELVLGAGDYPIQADGERIEAGRAVLETVPRALSVLRPVGS